MKFMAARNNHLRLMRLKSSGQQSSELGHKNDWPSTNGRGPSKINPSNSHLSDPIHKAELKPVLKEQTTPKSEPEEPQKNRANSFATQSKRKQLWLLF